MGDKEARFGDMINKILGSPWLLALLAGLLPPVYYLARNYFIFSLSQILFVAMAVPLVVTGFLSGLYLLLSRVKGRIQENQAGLESSRKRDRALNFLFSLACLAVFQFLMQQTYGLIFEDPYVLGLVLLLVSLLASLITALAGYTWLNTTLAVLLIMSAGQWAILGARVNWAKPDDPGRLGQKAVYDRVVFQRKPNVYFILPDGYTSQEALERIFKMDNSGFYNRLRSSGYRIYHPAFASYHATMYTLTSLFAMRHHYFKSAAALLDMAGGRELIGGKTYNPVVEIFRNNGYFLQYLSEASGLFTRIGAVDYVFPETHAVDGLGIFKSPLLNRVAHRLKRMSTKPITKQSYLEKIQERFIAAARDERPYFSFVHLPDPNHSSINASSQYLAKFRSGKYARKIGIANKTLLALVETIQKHDPGGLVIIAGDHGAWGYRGAWRDKDNPRPFQEVLREKGIPQSLMSLDLFGILLAIKFPPDYDGRYDSRIKSTVNLFRYVFSYLCGNDQLLGDKAEDSSYFNDKQYMTTVLKAVEDGRPLERWVVREP